ncbi:MAG: PorP/SprF family type IX secretion system membrane protein, partial [Bacteroidota bacterium]|nr:PorP/SprF family type IX secretion system membrane protein [Bacteroidota bacterium]
SALASFGYIVPLGYDHFLRFGISAGLGNNSIDFSQVDNIQDPAVLRLLSDNIFLDGQFGMNYQIKKLNLGFALPKLYEAAVFSEDYVSEIMVGRLKRYLFSGSYIIDLGPTSFLEPQALYRMTEGLPDFIEGGLVLHLKEMIWLGGSYRINYGATALFGFKIKDNLSFGYAYEFATSMSSSFITGTHEFQLGIRLGKHKDPNKKKDPKPAKEAVMEAVEVTKEEITEKIIEEEVIKEELPEIKLEAPEEKEVEIIIEKPVEKAAEPVIDETAEKPIVKAPEKSIESKPLEVTVVRRGKHPLELEKGHYVITGVFSHERNAQRYRDAIKDRGYNANYGYNSENNYFYVFIHISDVKGETKKEMLKYREKHEFKDAWLLSVENEAQEVKPEAKEVIIDSKKINPVDNNEIKEQVELSNNKGPKPDDLDFSHSFYEEPINIILEKGEVLTIQKGNMPGEMNKGYYIIAAVFKEKDKAQMYSDRLFKEGINSKVGFNSEKNYHYIYLTQSESEETAKNALNKYKDHSRSKDFWILEVE